MKYLFIILFVFMIGCLSAPDKKNYTIDTCFMFDSCMYYNKDNKDKSLCVDFRKECLNYNRFEYCKDDTKRPKDVNFQGCWDKLK